MSQGDRIPADARIVESSSLMVNEATLTGESNDVEKLGAETNLQDNSTESCKTNMLFQGTFVTSGNATALVVETGRSTRLGKMSLKIEELSVIEMPLREKLNKLAKYLSIIIIVYLSSSISFHLTTLFANGNISNMTLVARIITRSLTTALSIMPINIPLLVTIVALTGALVMAQNKVITRNLSSIETLGRVSVLCTDKTGTITQNHMTARCIYIPTKQTSHLYFVTGTDLNLKDKIIAAPYDISIENALQKQQEWQQENPTIVQPETPLEYLLVCALLNNDSLIIEEREGQSQKGQKWTVAGNSTDA